MTDSPVPSFELLAAQLLEAPTWTMSVTATGLHVHGRLFAYLDVARSSEVLWSFSAWRWTVGWVKVHLFVRALSFCLVRYCGLFTGANQHELKNLLEARAMIEADLPR